MKKRTFTNPVIAMLAVALFAGACGTSNKMAHQGFGGGFGEGKKTESTISATTPSESVQTPQIPSTAHEIATAEINNNVITPTGSEAVKSSVSKTAAKSAVNLKSVFKQKGAFKALRQAKKAFNNPAETNLDKGNLLVFILLFILCFIIPPLAYFLATGNTDNMFWICLICFLLGFSYFFIHLGGLLALISVVIALLGLFS